MYFNCSLAAVVRIGFGIDNLEFSLERNAVVAVVSRIQPKKRIHGDPAKEVQGLVVQGKVSLIGDERLGNSGL